MKKTTTYELGIRGQGEVLAIVCDFNQHAALRHFLSDRLSRCLTVSPHCGGVSTRLTEGCQWVCIRDIVDEVKQSVIFLSLHFHSLFLTETQIYRRVQSRRAWPEVCILDCEDKLQAQNNKTEQLQRFLSISPPWGRSTLNWCRLNESDSQMFGAMESLLLFPKLFNGS